MATIKVVVINESTVLKDDQVKSALLHFRCRCTEILLQFGV